MVTYMNKHVHKYEHVFLYTVLININASKKTINNMDTCRLYMYDLLYP